MSVSTGKIVDSVTSGHTKSRPLKEEAAVKAVGKLYVIKRNHPFLFGWLSKKKGNYVSLPFMGRWIYLITCGSSLDDVNNIVTRPTLMIVIAERSSVSRKTGSRSPQ